MEKQKIIEEYTAIINPQKLGGAISIYYEIESKAETFKDVIKMLNESETVTQIYRVTGSCRIHVHAVASSQDDLEHFTLNCLDKLPRIQSITTNVILSRIKDVKGLRL